MTNPKHTPEPSGPLALQRLDTGRNGYADWNTFALRTPENYGIAEIGHIDRATSETSEAYANRLRDCFNACAGLNPEAIPALLVVVEQFAAVWEDWHKDYPSARAMRADLTAVRGEK